MKCFGKGDRVQVLDGSIYDGDTGEVIEYDGKHDEVLVRLDWQDADDDPYRFAGTHVFWLH